MADDDAPKPINEEDDIPLLVVPTHSPLPPPPEVHYTRPIVGQKGSTNIGRTTPKSSGGTDPSEPVNHGAGMAAGLTFVTSVIAGLLAGGWLDQHYIHSSTPWGTLGMTIVGTAVGFTNMFRLLSRGDRRKP